MVNAADNDGGPTNGQAALEAESHVASRPVEVKTPKNIAAGAGPVQSFVSSVGSLPMPVSMPTITLLRKASQQFHDHNPYVPMVTKGNVYLPLEASAYMVDPKDRVKYELEGEDSDPEPDDDDDEELMKGVRESYQMQSILSQRAGAEGEVGDWTPHVVWHVRIVPDSFNHPRHTVDGQLKPRRPFPHVKVSEFLQNVKNADGTWVHEAPLNSWPALHGFLLISITSNVGFCGWKIIRRLWDATAGKPLPDLRSIRKPVRAKFLAPRWMEIGWSPASPGFVWWYSEQHGAPRLLFGNSMVHRLEADPAPIAGATITNVYIFAHRYPVERESWRDRLTVHTLVLLEWSHGLFTTVTELAWLNGIGGYGVKSNWCEDKLSPDSGIMRAFPKEMIKPWQDTKSEIRFVDMACKNAEEFEAYLQKYSNRVGLPLSGQRFVDPERYLSGPLKLRHCTAGDLAGYTLNYIQRNFGYDELRKNCQTYCTDLFAFLTGKKHKPYSNLASAVYTQRLYAFLYTPDSA